MKTLRTIIIITLILLSSSWCLLNNTLSGQLFKYGIKLNVSDFKITEKLSEIKGNNRINMIVADSKTTKLFMSITNPDDHVKYIRDKVFLLLSLYEPTTSPYAEVITSVRNCPNELKPKQEKIPNGIIYRLFAGEKYNYGICTKNLIKYNSIYGLFDCKKKGIIEIRIFSKESEGILEKTVKSFSCNI